MAHTKKTPPKEPLQVLRVCTIKLTPTAEQTLQQIGQEASDALGWTVSNSALLRAMLSYVEQQSPAWAATALFPLIEQEIAQGRVWGKKKRE